MCIVLKIFVFLQPLFSDGALAQLARAFDWQSRGREFDSHTLHKKKHLKSQVLFLYSLSPSFLQKMEEILPFIVINGTSTSSRNGASRCGGNGYR